MEKLYHAFGHLTKHVMLPPYLAQNDTRSDKDYNLYVFDLRYQKIDSTTHTVTVNFRLTADINAGR